MKDSKHFFKLCEVGSSHGDDQACMQQFAIKCFHFLERMRWLGKPAFHLLQVFVFLVVSQRDSACFNVPVKANICHRTSERLVFCSLPGDAKFLR